MSPSERSRRRGAGPVRVGLFGIIGAGNIGNDAALEAVLGFLERDHPGIALDAMTTNPEQLAEHYGIPAVPLSWQHPWKHPYEQAISGPGSMLLLLGGKLLQTVRTVRWVRAHDVVIVPGAGVMETSLPMRPWETPYSLFVMALSGRLFGTEVAMVSIGADVGQRRATRALLNAAARLSSYRSFRDERSRSAMQTRGLDVSGDHVFADMVFSLPVEQTSPSSPSSPSKVGLGVMEYAGSNDDDRKNGPAIFAEYEDAMKRLVRRLVDSGRTVTLLVGDQCDYPVAEAIIADIRAYRPELDASAVTSAAVITFADLMREIAPLDVVIATRFHNLVAAMKLGKPTISIDYAVKSTDLMADMALSQYAHPIRSLSVDRLMEDVEEAERLAPHLSQKILEACAAKIELTEAQFLELSADVFPQR